jgi:hypothetical protein
MDTPENTQLQRREAAEFLQGRGFPVSARTLEKLACAGGGPPIKKWGRRVLYEPAALLAWATARLSAPVSSTSETSDV